MPLIIIHHYHTHHYPGMDEQLQGIRKLLEQLELRIKKMLDPVIQDLMAQAQRNVSFEKAFDLGFKALQTQISILQSQVAVLQAGSILTDADKATISATTSDLANSISTLQGDIPANTPAAATTEPVAPVEAPPAAEPVVAADVAPTATSTDAAPVVPPAAPDAPQN